MQGLEHCPQMRRFGVFEVDMRAAELRKRGVRIKLQEQPFLILSLLIDHPAEVVTREELRRKLWPGHTFVDFDRGLNKAMTKLRSALGDSAESPMYIETIPRHGYRFLAPVHTREIAKPKIQPSIRPFPELASKDERKTSEQPQEHHVPVLSFLQLSFRSTRRWLYTAAIIVVILLCAMMYLRIRQPTVLGGSSNVFSPRRSVAVVGFKNLSGDTQENWLSTAFSDWLMTELTAGEQLRAIPAESVARMKMELSLPDVDSLSVETLSRIRKNLGTDYVVVGSYALLGAESQGQLRLDLRLQDTRTGETIGAISEAGTEAHLLDMVSRAGQHLRNKLGVRAVTTEEAAEVAIALPSNAAATKFYSEGLGRLRIFDPLAARDLLLKAVASEPDYALSHAALAAAWGQLGYDENAKTEAKKAFDLSANLSRAERLLVEGRYREMCRDWDRAIEIYRALFDFFPDNLDYGLALAGAELGANKWKETLATIAAMRQLPVPLRDDPRIDLAENDAARPLGDSKRAEAALERAVEKAHAAGTSLLLAKARREQAWLYENSGKQDQVEGAVREAKLLYIAANDRLGLAAATTLDAISLERQGDYLGAKKGYEESLAIYKESGSKLSQSNEYDNLGDIQLYLGDLQSARKSYSDALKTYAEIGDLNGVALAKIGLGDVFLALGNISEAKKMFEDSFETCGRLGNLGRQGDALAGLGRILELEGNISEARKDALQARAMLDGVGDDSEAAHLQLQLAELSLDEGKNAEAEEFAERAASVFERTKSARYEIAAHLLLARSLLAQGKLTQAHQRLNEALAAASRSHTREMELSGAIVAARLEASTGHTVDASNSKKELDHVISAAEGSGFRQVAMEARLALGELEINSDKRAEGRLRLEILEKESTAGGLLRIARRAAAVLQVEAAKSSSVRAVS